MYLRPLFKIIIVVALAVAQIGFVSGLPAFARELNLIVIFLVFSLEFSRDKKMIWWFLLIGFIFDIYTSYFFGFFLLFWPLVFLFAGFLSANFFTNRSLYSFLGLTFFTTVFYYFFFYLFFYLLEIFIVRKSVFFLLAKNFWFNFGGGVVLNLAAAVIIFYLFNLASNRLKPVFIIREHKS